MTMSGRNFDRKLIKIENFRGEMMVWLACPAAALGASSPDGCNVQRLHNITQIFMNIGSTECP
jgi:hypothetical protein